jgi:signal transduction histidine kinase/DNA-binding response OmpR family regulator
MFNEMQRQLLFHDDIELVFKHADHKADLQVRQIEELVDEDIDLLIVSPSESTPLKPAIEAVYAKGIPVILLDRKVESDQYTAYIGADNQAIGQEVARYTYGLLNGSGRVLELYESPRVNPFVERHNGFELQIRNYPAIHADTCRAILHHGTLRYIELIRKNHYDVIFSHTDVGAYLAQQIADSLGLADGVSFIGIDALPGPNEGLDYVDRGILKASFLYPTGGDVAIDVAASILHNEPFQKETRLQSMVIDPNNVKLMQVQVNKLAEQHNDILRLGEKLTVIRNIYQTERALNYLFATATIIAVVLGAYAFKSLVDKRRTNRELKNINEKVMAYSNQAEEANQQKLTFFTNISHEFRTPLTLILSPLEELLEKKELSHFRKEHNLIKTNALRLLRLVNQIMDFRKIDVGKMQIRVTESDLVTFVEEVVDAFQRPAQKKGIQLVFTHEKNLIPLWYDRSMLDKVLFNLLSNALKFTPRGGKINVKMEHNHLEEHVLVVVEDSGTGMSKQDLENVFSRFYQGEQNRSLGTGIGLALSKEIIQLHQGDISVQSVEGRGTRFEIKLKTGKAHFDESQLGTRMEGHVFEDSSIMEFDIAEEIPESDESSDVNLKEHTLLIIEDNRELRKYLVQRLKQRYNIVEAETVKDGIDKAYEEVPDLIICDLMLRKESGYDVIRTIKSDVRSSHIPIIVLTAKSDMDERIEGIKLGADDYITKPFNYTLLAERINTLLITHQKLREHYLTEVPSESQPVSSSKLNKKFVNQFVALVEENISNSAFGVNDICMQLGLSRIQLYRKVKAMLGYSVNDYINTVRLKKAKHLLTSSEHTISEIAHLVGYSSPAYFSTAFKNQFGVTPSEFKQTVS